MIQQNRNKVPASCDSNRLVNVGTCPEFDTMGYLCFMLIFDDFVDSKVRTAFSWELPQVRQNGPNGQNGDPKRLCLMKNAFCSMALRNSRKQLSYVLDHENNEIEIFSTEPTERTLSSTPASAKLRKSISGWSGEALWEECWSERQFVVRQFVAGPYTSICHNMRLALWLMCSAIIMCCRPIFWE